MHHNVRYPPSVSWISWHSYSSDWIRKEPIEKKIIYNEALLPYFDKIEMIPGDLHACFSTDSSELYTVLNTTLIDQSYTEALFYILNEARYLLKRF